MRHRNTLIIGISLLVVLAVVSWMLSQRERTTVATTPAVQATPSSVGNQPAATSASTEPQQLPGGRYEPNDPRWAERRRLRKEDPQYEWKTPIHFYGKVVDQDDRAIPGVEVEVGWTDMSSSGSSIRKLVSDNDGLFSMTDERGKAFVVHSLRKVGYEEAKVSNRYGFEYAGFWEPTYHEPDPNKPVVFHLRKKVEAEPMVKHGPTLFAARNDGNPTTFEVENARKATLGGGDIALTIRKGAKIGKRFDWTASVEAVGGAGLIHSEAEFMATAPRDGYQKQWMFTQRTDAENYQSEVRAKFFVRTANGKYARLEMRILPEYQEQGAVDLVTYFNPSGSTNLEFDPSRLAK